MGGMHGEADISSEQLDVACMSNAKVYPAKLVGRTPADHSKAIRRDLSESMVGGQRFDELEFQIAID
jgi:hypothetical protein